MLRHEQVQRIRVTFGVSEPMCHVSVLDMNRTWERLLNRAHAPVSYTEGFNPHARLYFAAALPLGYCSTCELVDIVMAEPKEVDDLRQDLTRAAPPGIEILAVEQPELFDRAPIKGMHGAEYEVTLWGAEEGTVERSVQTMLERKIIERERIKKGVMRAYDLRPLIRTLRAREAGDQTVILDMRLACGPGGSGRPEEIVDELAPDGLERIQIVRKALIWGKPTEES